MLELWIDWGEPLKSFLWQIWGYGREKILSRKTLREISWLRNLSHKGYIILNLLIIYWARSKIIKYSSVSSSLYSYSIMLFSNCKSFMLSFILPISCVICTGFYSLHKMYISSSQTRTNSMKLKASLLGEIEPSELYIFPVNTEGLCFIL